MLTRRTTFKLYPTKQQEKKLFEWRRLHCYPYLDKSAFMRMHR